MTDNGATLTPGLAISLALQRDERRRFRHGDDLMAQIVADDIIRCLEERNYVVMQKPPVGDFSRIEGRTLTDSRQPRLLSMRPRKSALREGCALR